MASEMNDCATVADDYIDTAPVRIVVGTTFRATPTQVFTCFRDADAWPRWAPAITRVTWTSPEPFGIGTTRTVEMLGGAVGDEVFTAWEDGKHMAFRFTRSNVPVSAFAEDYQVEDLGDGRVRVQWTMAMTLEGFSAIIAPLTSPLLRMGNAWMLGRFGKLVENDYAG